MTIDEPLVLIVEDDDAMREVLSIRVRGWGYRVCGAESGDAVDAVLQAESPDLVITDVVLPGMSGFDLLDTLKGPGSNRPVIVMTAHGSVDWAVNAMKRGAFDFVTKPLDYDNLKAILTAARNSLRSRDATQELENRLDSQDARLGLMIGPSPAMREVFRLTEFVAGSSASAIITGESGSGKEMVARTIHELSDRRSGPYVAINTAAIPAGLIESEIFGHEKGAFTGATASRPGCFELADGGTLLLDEIAEMPMSLQPKLLRILEEGATRRVGGKREIPFDVRVLAATNRPIDQVIGDNRLREDLLYRLNVFTIDVPPLRQHPEDIPILAQHFVRDFNSKHERTIEGLAQETIDLLFAYSWPGNIRELRNVVERATIIAGSGWLLPSHLPPYMSAGADGSGGNNLTLPGDVTAREAERRLILHTLEATGQNKAEAARRLDVDVKTIRNKLKGYGESTQA
ncbi:MAG: sigma-54 dependent transcriptional regulator [Gemmatimonadota bacterium]